MLRVVLGKFLRVVGLALLVAIFMGSAVKIENTTPSVETYCSSSKDAACLSGAEVSDSSDSAEIKEETPPIYPER